MMIPAVRSLRCAALIGVLLVAGCATAGRSLELVSGSAVVYPPDAQAAGIQGYVVVRYDVDASGRVINPRVVAADPPEVFDAAALETVSSWRFRPARGASQPRIIEGVESRVQFTLGAGEAYRNL
jgi:TonB family protein